MPQIRQKWRVGWRRASVNDGVSRWTTCNEMGAEAVTWPCPALPCPGQCRGVAETQSRGWGWGGAACSESNSPQTLSPEMRTPKRTSLRPSLSRIPGSIHL